MNKIFAQNLQLLVMLVAVSGLLQSRTYASEEKLIKDPVLEAEATEAQAEEDAEQKLDPDTIKRQFQGKFSLYKTEEAEQIPDVVGAFTEGKHIYLVKSSEPAVVEKLKRLDGKQTTVIAKVRNQQKYLIVLDVVVETGAAPAYSRRRGGI